MKMKRPITVLVLLVLLGSSLFAFVPMTDQKEKASIVGRNRNGPDETLDISHMPVGRSENGLAARWSFEEGSGDHVGDSSGNVNKGTLNVGGGDNANEKWVEGVKGKALKFDGVDDYVNFSIAPSLQIGKSNHAIELWFQTDDQDIGPIINKLDGWSDDHDDLNLYSTETGDLRYQAKHFDYLDLITSGHDYRDQQWHHVVITRTDSGPKGTKLYVDGVLKDSGEGVDFENGDTYFQIGHSFGGTHRWYSGLIDEVSIYNRALSASEIRAHYCGIKLGEQDEFGGSWFDNFDDDSGIEDGLGGQLEADEHTVGLWHFDEGSGNKAKDASGNGNDGTLQNIEEGDWVDGRFGKGLDFEGQNEYVSTGTTDFPSGNNPATMEAWVNLDALPNEAGLMGYGNQTGGTNKGWEIVITTITVDIRNFADTPLSSNFALSTGKWYYIAGVYTTTQLKLYINGMGVKTVNFNSLNLQTFVSEIGRRPYTGTGYLNGQIDEVRISRVARTPEEIRHNYERGVVLRNGKVELAKNEFDPGPNCIGYWNFDEGKGNTAFDSSGNGNHGTLKPDAIDSQVKRTENGKYRNALKFDGVDDYVEVPHSENLNIGGNGKGFTAEAWINCSNPMPTQQILRKGTGGGRYEFKTWNSGTTLRLTCDDGSGFPGLEDSISANDGKWHHVAFTKDETDNKVRFYYDGNLLKTSPETCDGTESNTDPLWIGSIGGTEETLRGILDNVLIYGRALTLEEIQHNYNIINILTYPINTTLTSTYITPSLTQIWSTLSITKTEPANTYLNVSVINAETNATIPDFDNITTSNIDLTPLNDLGITSIRLKAYFSGNGSATPSLDSWGVEWTMENAWRDSFTGNSKVAYPNKVDENTVGYWRFDEGSGNEAKDSSGNGNDGVINGARFVPGPVDNALEFDGANDYVQVSDSPSLDINSQISMELWFYPKEPNLHHFLIDKLGTNNVRAYRLQITGNSGTDSFGNDYVENSILFGISHNNVNVIYLATTADHPVTVNKWNHIAATFDGATMKIILNGIRVSEGKSQGNIAQNNNDLLIGVDYDIPGNADYYSKGIIDEVRISNIARTPDEIRQAYQTGITIKGGQAQLSTSSFNPGVDPGCVGYWSFNEGKGDTAYDGSGNENHGTINGANWTEGLMGSALEFDGEDDYVDSNYHLNPAETHSVSLWVYFPSDGRSGNVFGLSDSPSTYDSWRISVGSTQISFTAWGGGGSYRDRWFHIAAITDMDAKDQMLYVDGVRGNGGGYEGVISTTSLSAHIGAYNHRGTPSSFFGGFIDEVSIYDRALTPSEIRIHANHFHQNSTLRSIPITLPANHIWSTFHCNRSIPNNTFLNISIHDTATNESLLTNTNHTGELYLDMSEIDPIVHPSIYLQAYFESNRTETPILYDWAVNWTSGTGILHPPELIQNLPEMLLVKEDTPAGNIVDLAEYFNDRYSTITPPVYAIESVTDDVNITLSLNGSKLDVTNLTDNWTGLVQVIANCTNMHGLSVTSNEFIINVTPVEDAPIWNTIPPVIIVKQSTSTVSNYSLDDYVTDAEGDELEFVISSSDVNISTSLDIENHVIIEHMGSLVGNLSIHASVFQFDNDSLFSNISIPIRVIENAIPQVLLLTPRNGNIVTDTSVTLSWSVTDVDTSAENITCDVYFGNTSPPGIYQSDWNNTEFQLNGLVDGETYYWYVLPRDENGNGTCLNGTWNFTVSTSRPIPTVTSLSPLHGSIINKTSVNLAWSTVNPLDEYLNFDVYIGNSVNNLTKVATTKNETYLLLELKDNTTYYWKIIPWSENITGVSGSGVWNFTVRMDFVRTHGLKIKCELQYFNITLGSIGRFNFIITNMGNQPERVLLSIENWLLKSVVLNVSKLKLDPGEVGFFQLMISIDSSTVISDYDVVIIASLDRAGDEEYTERHPIMVHVISENIIIQDESEPKDRGFMDLLKSYWEVPLVIISGLVAIFGYFQFKRRKNKFQNLRQEIDRIYLDLSDVKGAISELDKVSSKLTEYMDKERITDNQYLILDRKINDYVMDLKGTARLGDLKGAVQALPPAIRSKIEGILKDGKITLDEVHELENVLWEEDISEEQRAAIGSFAVQWLKEDTGEVVDWGSEMDDEDISVEADIVHIPTGVSMGKSFVEIVKETTPSAQPVSPAPIQPQAVQSPMPGVIMPYAVRGRTVTPVTIGQGAQEMQVHLPETGTQQIPPAPGVSMPVPAIAPTEETKALPQGDILAAVSGILDGVETQQTPPAPPKAPPLPAPEPDAISEGEKQPLQASLPPPKSPPPLPPPD